MIPADILTVLIILAVVAPLGWLAGRAHGRYLERRREPEPETYGDDGGHPYREIPLKLTPDQKRRLRTVVDRMADTPAPETGSGLRTGDKSQ